jgi:predicted ATPase
VYVHGLRRALGAERVETRGTSYRVSFEAEELDVSRFERLLGEGREALAAGAPGRADELLSSALTLWRGEALADLGDSPVRGAAASLAELRLQALELRIDARLALGEHDEVLGQLDGLVAAEPYRERLRELLVLALYRAGRQQDALAAYRDARRMFADELGVEPSPALRELERAVLRQDSALDVDTPERHVRPRLPTPPTPLVGRRLERAAVAAILRREDVRLVTLTGAGGTGKTRLALAVAEDLAHESRDGAAFVDLSSAEDASVIGPAIGQAIGVADAHQVNARLADSSLLLVLDNLEQIASEVAPFVGRLLADAPRLRVLATSRIPLRLSGEHEYPVPPLVTEDAVALFSARASAVDPQFALTPATSTVVVGICQRLDGLPLAVELAAARVRALPLSMLERRLDNALDVLVGGARDLPTRQRTLRATLDWSYALLDEGAQELLAQLGVFAGGFVLDDLQAVVGAESVDQLERLVEASLVRRRGERFTLLETIREYALARVVERGGLEELRGRHLTHYLAVAEAAWQAILAGGDAENEGMRVLARETDNIRGALAWAIECGDGEALVRLAEAQRWFWIARGRFVEARATFDAAVDAAPSPGLRATALNGAATFALRQGNIERASEQWKEALEIVRALGDESEAARFLAELGGIAVAQGDLETGQAMYEETVVLFHRQGQLVREGIALSNLSAISDQRGDLQAAVGFGERAIELQSELGDRPGLAVSLANLAPSLIQLGEATRARAVLRESLELGQDFGYSLLFAHILAVGAELAAVDHDDALAARLLGATEAAFEALGGELPEGERRAFVRIRKQLDASEEDVERWCGEGREWTLDLGLERVSAIVDPMTQR